MGLISGVNRSSLIFISPAAFQIYEYNDIHLKPISPDIYIEK